MRAGVVVVHVEAEVRGGRSFVVPAIVAIAAEVDAGSGQEEGCGEE